VTISISGQVPAEAQNGMTRLEEEWTKDRTPDPVFAIVKIERHGTKFVDATQEHQATMKFSHIEPATGAIAERLKALLDELCNARGGAVATDVELDIEPPEEPAPDFETPLADKAIVEPEADGQ
jgi:hypothetical protein